MQRIYRLNFNSDEVNLMTFHDGINFVLVGRSNYQAALTQGKIMASPVICQKMCEAVQFRGTFTKGSNFGDGKFKLLCNHGKYPTGYFDASSLHSASPLTICVSVKCPYCNGNDPLPYNENEE